jgi:type VI secretion system secreted protein Hcp
MELTNLNRKLIGTMVLVVLTATIIFGMNQLVFAEDPANDENEIALDAVTTTKIYARITGQIQGEIQGDVTEAGHEDAIQILSFNHAVVSPRDSTTGMATGARQHKPITITKPLDKASPQLMYALVNNERLDSVIFEFYTINKVGGDILYYQIELVNAYVASIRTVLVEEETSGYMTTYEQVSFTYQQITWTDTVDGYQTVDDWESPVV